MDSEKQKVALSSVAAAFFLVVIKAAAGLATGSLGLLSEAAHSTLDLGAAAVTLLAVRFSDKPADSDHLYGHGKIENISALIETALLLATCGWIVYESIERLFYGKSVEITGISWGIGIMLLSIAVDISRASMLKRAARTYRSQALEADALHFSSDVWSSAVVIAGLVCVKLSALLNMPALRYGDPCAALGVALLVIIVSLRLARRSIDVLLDTAPQGMIFDIVRAVKAMPGVLEVGAVRVRVSGPQYFIELRLGISKNESHRTLYAIVDRVTARLQQTFPNSDVVISTFPIDLADRHDREIHLAVKRIIDAFPACSNIHNLQVYETAAQKHVALHLEVRENMSLAETHELSHRISRRIQDELCEVGNVSINFEYAEPRHILAHDITAASAALIQGISEMINRAPDKLNCHDIRVFSRQDRLSIFLHCALSKNYPTRALARLTNNLSRRIRAADRRIENVHIHVEPKKREG